MPAREKDTYCIHSVENALALLEALCEEGEEVSLSSLSQRLNLTKASLFRLLATFENHGYVEREPGSRKYRLGMAAYEIGQKFLSHMELLRKARPAMEQLAREFNEAVYLAVRRNNEVLFLDMVDSTQQVKIVPLVGRRFPMATTAPGKIFLSHPLTAQAGTSAPTKTAPPLPEGDQVTTQEKGAFVDRAGFGEGATCIATPIFSASGEIAGVLTMLGPEYRMTQQRIETDLLPAMTTAREVISSRLGYLDHVFGDRQLG